MLILLKKRGLWFSRFNCRSTLSRKSKCRSYKKNVYEEFEVKEYFIVDPRDKSVITYYLENKKYVVQGSQKGKLVSKLLNAEIDF